MANAPVTPAVQDQIRHVVRTFAPGEVTILEGPFKLAEQADLKYLLSLDPNRFLSGFRSEAGLEPKAKKYGGWESQGVAGQTLGHWLTACALMHKVTGEPKLIERLSYAVDELAECQRASGDGALIAYPDGKKIFREIAAGDVRSQGFDLNGGWVPWYTNHKVLAGLIDAYRYAGNGKALGVATGFADWAIDVTKNLTPAQWQTMLSAEHGGMNEVLAELYAITGEKKYLELARKFHHDMVLIPLAEGRDVLPGLHANTQIPKLIGLARLYELDGDESDRRAATFFWNTVVDTQTFANGGNSTGEHFGKPHALGDRLKGDTAETCNTYNMLKLTRHLFTWETDPAAQMKLADYAERATFNHILASVHPKTGMVVYYCRVGQGSKKDFSTPFDSFWCCVGTGMENHARYADAIYFKSGDTLTVNQFIASEVTWAEKGATVRQETKFPDEPKTSFVIKSDQAAAFTLRLRYPNWAMADAKITVNGESANVHGKPGSYIELKRTWKSGDRVELALPMGLRTEALPDVATRQAIFVGPILLAGQVSAKSTEHPVIVDDGKPVEAWLKPNQGELMFATASDVSRPEAIELKPFFRVTEGHYSVYFDRFNAHQWEARQAEHRAEQERLADLEARTIDEVEIGAMQPERDHELTSEKSTVGEHAGRKWRHADSGGFFEFTMKVDPQGPNDLVLTYWGEDTGRDFDVLVDGQKLATVNLKAEHPDAFFDVTYPLDPAWTSGKASVRVRLRPHEKKTAGGLYGARIVRQK